MKKLTRPEIEFIEFDENDVIATSGLILFAGGPEGTPGDNSAAEQQDWVNLTWIKEQTNHNS